MAAAERQGGLMGKLRKAGLGVAGGRGLRAALLPARQAQRAAAAGPPGTGLVAAEPRRVADHGLPVLYALFVWWFSTGLILYLDGLPRRTFRWSMLGATVLAWLGALRPGGERATTPASSAPTPASPAAC